MHFTMHNYVGDHDEEIKMHNIVNIRNIAKIIFHGIRFHPNVCILKALQKFHGPKICIENLTSPI